MSDLKLLYFLAKYRKLSGFLTKKEVALDQSKELNSPVGVWIPLI